jgi:hypothetical protein
MTAGISATNLANVWLNILRNTTGTAIAAVFVKLHTETPAPLAPPTLRSVRPRDRPSPGLPPLVAPWTITGTAPSWTNGGTSETLTHVSFWDSSTAGNFLGSAALSSSQAWASGNVYTLNTCTWALTPIAA